MRSESGPLMRTIATPASPAGVAIAAMVSSWYIEVFGHLSNLRVEGNTILHADAWRIARIQNCHGID
jgi:hypothetical protein